MQWIRRYKPSVSVTVGPCCVVSGRAVSCRAVPCRAGSPRKWILRPKWRIFCSEVIFRKINIKASRRRSFSPCDRRGSSLAKRRRLRRRRFASLATREYYLAPLLYYINYKSKILYTQKAKTYFCIVRKLLYSLKIKIQILRIKCLYSMKLFSPKPIFFLGDMFGKNRKNAVQKNMGIERTSIKKDKYTIF